MQHSFGVIGGDRRQAALTHLLEEDGYVVYSYGLEKWGANGTVSLDRAAEADVVVLPLPLCREEGVLNCEEMLMTTECLFRQLRPHQIVLAGNVQEEQWKEAKDCGLLLLDYFRREELVVANAAATAEVAVRVAMERLDRTLLGQECLVLGFGRIGKLLSYRLHGLGARVTAAARKPEDLAWIRAYGWDALNTRFMDGELGKFGVVFNTIPFPVLDGGLLEQLPARCLCIELASVRGIDGAMAEQQGKQYVWARSLPGRFVPCTAAEAIRDAIYYMI